MDVILQAIKDLIKFKIISSVNTGDKTLDNLMVVLFTAILVAVSTKSFWSTLWVRLRVWRGVANLKEQDVALYCANKLKNNFKKTVICASERSLLLSLVDYIDQNIDHLVAYFNCTRRRTTTTPSCVTNQSRVTLTTDKLSNDDLFRVVTDIFMPANRTAPDLVAVGPCPLYISKKGKIVGITSCSSQATVVTMSNRFLEFKYQTEEAYQEFMDVLQTYYNPKTADVTPEVRYMEYENNEKHLIYPDRTFDNIVSRHKQAILAHLDNFTRTNKGKSGFNGFGSYNLGIIIYGEPGTGKTSFIKAICNYLQRNGFIKDMRDIKTNDAFKQLFKSKLNELVYIFEEFDCVQGVISRDIDSTNADRTVDARKKELGDKYVKLLSVQASAEKDSPNIAAELEETKQELRNLENRLSLDNILTVLDGPVEMRNRVIIACTNYIDRIDPALLRPGRFDIKIKLDAFTTEETVELLEKMFADEDTSYISGKKFKPITPTNLINLCHELQDLKAVVDSLTV